MVVKQNLLALIILLMVSLASCASTSDTEEDPIPPGPDLPQLPQSILTQGHIEIVLEAMEASLHQTTAVAESLERRAVSGHEMALEQVRAVNDYWANYIPSMEIYGIDREVNQQAIEDFVRDLSALYNEFVAAGRRINRAVDRERVTTPRSQP